MLVFPLLPIHCHGTSQVFTPLRTRTLFCHICERIRYGIFNRKEGTTTPQIHHIRYIIFSYPSRVLEIQTACDWNGWLGKELLPSQIAFVLDVIIGNMSRIKNSKYAHDILPTCIYKF